MGLDIVLYKNVRFVSVRDDMQDWAAEQDFLMHVGHGNYDAYSAWAGPLKKGYYLYTERENCLQTGYGGYAMFRDELEQMIVKTYQQKRPFRELINFTDCDGIICNAMCQVMLNDFKSHQNLAEQMTAPSRQKYYAIRDALASVGINDFLSYE